MPRCTAAWSFAPRRARKTSVPRLSPCGTGGSTGAGSNADPPPDDGRFRGRSRHRSRITTCAVNPRSRDTRSCRRMPTKDELDAAQLADAYDVLGELAGRDDARVTLAKRKADGLPV